jgi:release factor glutamine methyltransferase
MLQELSTVEDLFRKGRVLLHGVANPAVEAKVLLLLATGLSEAEFLGSPLRGISARKERAFDRLVERRLSDVPLAYITGRKEFWSLPFKVGPGVLIPRPETELVVEKALELARTGRETIVDIGTGSGNIAVALARELPEARIIATDISARALRAARFNAEINQVERIAFVRGNLYAPLKGLDLAYKCDCIVSNPPYVAAAEWEALASEVRDHEPKRALWAGKTGFEFIRRLVRGATDYLRPGGHLLVEIGDGQAEGALALFDDRWTGAEVFDDLRGIPRVVKAVRRG